MPEMDYYEVSFTAAAPKGAPWHDRGDGYKIIDPGIAAPYIIVPADAVITKVEPPVKDGYYVGENDLRTYRRSNGEWWRRMSGKEWRRERAPHFDDQVRNGDMTFLAPLNAEGA